MTSRDPQTILKAEGESVTLGCSYETSPEDTGSLDIEWSVVSPDTTEKDQMVRSNERSRQILNVWKVDIHALMMHHVLGLRCQLFLRICPSVQIVLVKDSAV